MARRPKVEKLPQLPYQTSMCLVCGRAARPFDSTVVPKLWDYLQRRAQREELRAACKEQLGGEGCFFAPKCGVSVCANGAVVP